MRIESEFIRYSYSRKNKAEENHYLKAHQYNEKLKIYEQHISENFRDNTSKFIENINIIEQLNNEILTDFYSIKKLHEEYCKTPYKTKSHMAYLEILIIKYGMNVIHTGYYDWYAFNSSVEMYEKIKQSIEFKSFSLTLQEQQDEGISPPYLLKEMNYCKFNFARQIAYFNVLPPVRNEGIIDTQSITDELFFEEYEKIDKYNLSDFLKYTITNIRIALKMCEETIYEARERIDVEEHNRGQDEKLLKYLIMINEFFTDFPDTLESNSARQLEEKYKTWQAMNNHHIPEHMHTLITLVLKFNANEQNRHY